MGVEKTSHVTISGFLGRWGENNVKLSPPKKRPNQGPFKEMLHSKGTSKTKNTATQGHRMTSKERMEDHTLAS